MDARTDGNREISLLPYLSGRTESPPVGLSLLPLEPLAPDGSASFTILHDNDPLTRVVQASFVTDSGSTLKNVFLLLPKDRYNLERDDLWPLSNRDIEGAWQRAFALHAAMNDGSRYLFADQLVGDGTPNLFSSLFLCKTRQLFFHPPCPLCGNPLSLCRDDDLLLSCGLHAYSGSTKRYLQCDSCARHDSRRFYVPVRGHDDPEHVHDVHALLDAFRHVPEQCRPECGFPCPGCPEQGICYGENRFARTRIVPFSFFPFYFLIFESLSLPALDFLQLVSGASIDGLIGSLSGKRERGRVRCLESVRRDGLVGAPLFPVHDERFFLEVLFLKLSFLGDVLRQIVPPGEDAGQPAMRLAIDRIWVGLAGQSGLLPPFWNFRTRLLDIVRPAASAQHFSSTASSNLLQAALLWFSALVVNTRQSSRDILTSLKAALSESSGRTGLPDSLLSNPVFFAEQIFWEPEGKTVNPGLLSFWEKAIRLGFEFLSSAIHPDQQLSLDACIEQGELLRNEVRAAMFATAPLQVPQPSHEAGQSVDARIHGILANIIGKWRDRALAEPQPVPRGDADTLAETIVLSPVVNETPLSPVRDEEEWTETVILSARDQVVEPPPHSPHSPQPFPDDVMLETVVLSPGRAPSEAIQVKHMEEINDDIPQTIILSPGIRTEQSVPVPSSAVVSPAGAVKHEAAKGDDLPETVMINPQTARFRSKGWKD